MSRAYHMDDWTWIVEVSFSVREKKRRKERDPPGRFGPVRLSDGERRRQKTGGDIERS